MTHDQRTAMGHEIVKASEVLPRHDVVVRELDALQASGDVLALNEVARRAQAYQEYEQRAKATERANYFGRIKVAAEARIGSIDIDLYPRYTVGERDGLTAGLEFDGWEVPRVTRTNWRRLGMGLRTGQLEKAMKMVEERDDNVSTSQTVRELRELSIFWVDTKPLLKRYQELYRAEGLTVREVQRRSRAGTLGHYLCRPGRAPKRRRMRLERAALVASALGIDPASLPNAPRTRFDRAKVKRKLSRIRSLRGGRLDETYSLIRKALQELDSATAGGNDWGTAAAWQHLYEAEEIVGRALRRAEA